MPPNTQSYWLNLRFTFGVLLPDFVSWLHFFHCPNNVIVVFTIYALAIAPKINFNCMRVCV